MTLESKVKVKITKTFLMTRFIYFTEGVRIWNNDCLWCVGYNKGMILDSKVTAENRIFELTASTNTPGIIRHVTKNAPPRQ